MSFRCGECGRVSHNPWDELHRYCGACRKFFATVGWGKDLEFVVSRDRPFMEDKMRGPLGYWAWIREKFPADEEQVFELWQELENLRHRITEIEEKLSKYAPPGE
jgi:hypothetical protein